MQTTNQKEIIYYCYNCGYSFLKIDFGSGNILKVCHNCRNNYVEPITLT